jgi:hypothetical protein
VGTELVVVHPQTGEIVDLETLPTDRLAEAVLAFRERERDLKAMRIAVEGEVRHRYEQDLERRGVTYPSSKHVVCAGDFEIRIEGGNESVWDPDELEVVLRDLIDDGVISAADVTDVIRHETVVSRSSANALLDRLSGRAYDAVKRCRTWRRKGPGRVQVDRSIALPVPGQD